MKNKEIYEIRDALVRTGILKSCGCCHTTKYSDIVKKVDILSKEYLNSEIRTFNHQPIKDLLCNILKKIEYTTNVVNTRASDVDYIKACLKAIKIQIEELQMKILPIRVPSMPVEETRKWEKRR